MKNRTLLLQIVLGLLIAVGASNAQTTYERVRDELARVYTVIEPDGSTRYAKQFERWKWFWEPRLTQDGEFGTPTMYLEALEQVNEARQRLSKSVDVQDLPRWTELGPTAPDLPGESNIWNGIGRVNTVAVDPSNASTLLLGSAQGGIWRSTNGGSDWGQVQIPGLPLFGVSDIQYAPNNARVIYVATGDVNASQPGYLNGFPGFSYGVIKSTDGGTTWSRTGLEWEPDLNNLVARLWVDPRNADIVVAATYSGIQKSTDGGETWTLKSTTLPFRDLVGNPQTFDVLYASTFARFTGGASIYRSTDAGESWSVVISIPDANRIRLAVTPDDPSMVGAVASEYRKDNQRRYNGLEGVYRSTNFGASFTNLNVPLNLLGWQSNGGDRDGQGFYDLAMAISPVNKNIWFVGGINVWKSTTAGVSWSLSADWLGRSAPWVHADMHHLVYHPSLRRLYVCNDGGISRSNDDGVTWRDMSNGLKIQQYYGLATTDNSPNITLAGSQDNGTARSFDSKAFLHVLGGDGMMTAIDGQDPTLMYASQPYGTFYRSTNSGNNWQRISRASQQGESGGAWVAPITTDPNTKNVVYVGYTQVYKSTSAGQSWTRISQFDGVTSYLRNIDVSPVNSQFIAAANDNQVAYTTNGGGSWTTIQDIGGNVYIQDVKWHPTDQNIFWVTFGGFTASNKIVEFNAGEVTNITGQGLPNVPANAVVYEPGVFGRLYLATDEGVFFRDNGTETWVPYGAGMPTTIVSDITLLPSVGKLRVSTYGRGVWEVNAVQCQADKPSISAEGGITEICQTEGESITLTAPEGYASYAWNNGENTRSIELVTFNQTGTYTVTVDDNDGCRATSDEISITILRAPARPSIRLIDDNVLRSSAIGGIRDFQWFFEGNAIDGATEREYSPTMNGRYSVMVFNDDGCSAVSDEFVFDGIVSVEESDAPVTVQAKPNPFSETLTISLPAGLDRTVQLVDLQGAVVREQRVADGVVNVELDVRGLASGVYVIRAASATAQWSSTVVKR